MQQVAPEQATGRRGRPRRVASSSEHAAENGARTAPVAAGAPWDRYDAAIMAALAIATVLVHPVHRMLSRPYWFDEAWVAALTKAPLSGLARLMSSAPIGFVVLLRLVPGSGAQRGRLLVLGFTVLTVVATYLLVRALGWKQRPTARFAAAVSALVVMLAPLSLERNDLKQYTCDAFVAIVLLAVAAWTERTATRRSLVVFALAAVVAVPFSTTALFVTVALVIGLFAAAWFERSMSRAREIGVAGALTGVVLLAYFAVAVAPDLKPKLHAYWENYYLRGTPWATLQLVGRRLSALDHVLAMPAVVFVMLFVAGVVVLVRLRARALAVALPVLWLEMIIMGRIERYPFLDQRTSQFLLVSSLVVVALGAVGLVGALSRLWSTTRPLVGAAVAAVAGVTLAAMFAAGCRPYVRELNIPPVEDVRAKTMAVAMRRHIGDVILVSAPANFGFAYYWPHGRLEFHDDDSGQGFRVEVSGINAVYVHSRDDADVLRGVREAVGRLRAARAGSRLYIVRSHTGQLDQEAWRHAFDALHVVPRVAVVGVEPMLVLDRSALGS